MTKPRRLLAVALVAASMSAGPAAAETVVTRCASDDQTGGMNLATALRRGGLIRFNCPGGDATIEVTQLHFPPSGTEIDGGGRITLDGRRRRLILFDVRSGDLTLRGITIKNVRQVQVLAGFDTPADGGGPIVSVQMFPYPSVLDLHNGTAILDRVRILDCESPVKTQDTEVTYGEFRRNTGVALNVTRKGKLKDARFSGNQKGLQIGGGSIDRSFFTDNTVVGLSIVHPVSDVEVRDGYFRGNLGRGAVQLSQQSASSGSRTVTFRKNMFDGNQGSEGGAVSIGDAATLGYDQDAADQLSPTRFEFRQNTFKGNHGKAAGALYASLQNTLGMRMVGGIFADNVSDSTAGAVFWSGDSSEIQNGVFVGNSADDGAAIMAPDRNVGARWQVVNSLFSRNTARSKGGIVAAGPIELTNVTIARNQGVGFTGDLNGSSPDEPMIANSILSENTQGNCRGISGDHFRGRNLEFGSGDCAGATQADPLLDSMLIPQFGSPALTTGDLKICREDAHGRDLLFDRRGEFGVCAVGAFENVPEDKIIDLVEQTTKR